MATSAVVSESQTQPRAWPRVLVVVGRVALGAIFLYAAYSKLYFDGAWHLRDYQFFFAMAIDSYKMLPLSIVQWMARFLPWFELLLGGLLIVGAGVRWVGSITSALLLVFIGAMTRAKIMGLEINCGCFGNNEKLGWATLARDSSLLILALAVTIGAFLIKRRRAAVST
jgi:putative oxidoreductase